MIMDTNVYIEKLEAFLDNNTYAKTNEQMINTDTQWFNKAVKKILNPKTNPGSD